MPGAIDLGWLARRLALLCVVLVHGNAAWAQTVVSDDRLSLPEGPGSLEGVGENVEVDPNMGVMRWQVPVEVPKGFGDLAPQLDLQYSSSAGSSMVGIGWALSLPSIERSTFRGLPSYDRSDSFVAGGDAELVRINTTEPPVYRARFEKQFVRYTWHQAAAGTQGYWLAEYPDGRQGFFGADAGGTLVASARVGGAQGVFRYHLVEMRDPFGHRVRYDYRLDGNVALPAQIGWVYSDGFNPRYSVTFTYEPRDDLLSDCKGGFNEQLSQRLVTIEVFSGSERIRHYALSYEPYAVAGGFSRLARVERYGRLGGLHPIAFAFEYSRSLGGQCTTGDCQAPTLVDMGSLGLNISVGNTGLVDLNGDALPDVLHTPVEGTHRIFLNVLAAGGSQLFAPPVTSPQNVSLGLLSQPQVQLLDANGDGFADLVDATNPSTGTILVNRGTGDWESSYSVDTRGLPALAGNANFRFFDWDNDKHIDIIETPSQASTQYYTNLGDGTFAVEPGTFPALGRTFANDNLRLEEMNGDGMLDAVVVGAGFVSFRLNLGYGQWGPWQDMLNVPANLGALLPVLDFVDINGDALSDLVIVEATSVRYALNRSAVSYETLVLLDTVDGQPLPDRTDKTVLFADMNGNGSEDVVWIDVSGETTYLELFPVRPNLLSRISNGIGMVTVVTYGTSVEHMARDGGAEAWPDRLPHPMAVVDRVDTFDELSNVHEVTDYVYHDGFYDGVEKQFRGYRRVEAHLHGDASIEAGLTTREFDVGATDAYKNGLLLYERLASGGQYVRSEQHTWADCPLDDVPGAGLRLPVRHVCETGVTVTVAEGAPGTSWVTLETTYAYDGFGNRTLEARHGVTQIGGSGCPACSDPAAALCGPLCLGDEAYVETTYVPPSATSGLWLLRAPSRKVTYGTPGDTLYSEETSFYDGPPFVGLAEGQLTHGLVSRTSAKLLENQSTTIDVSRMRHDAHGNVVESLDALGAPGSDEHRRAYAYDADGLRLTQVDIFLADADSAPYQLRREVLYEPSFGKPVEASRWMRVKDGVVQSGRDSTFFAYDEHARLIALAKPGDDLAAPTEAYNYELTAPVSRILIERRSQSGQALDLETARCIDGRGRQVQERTRIAAGRYQVNGFKVFNVRGTERRIYQPYEAASATCGPVPTGVRFAARTYDAAGRLLTVTAPDEDLYGTASVRETRYAPLVKLEYDAEDTDPASTHYDTPKVIRSDGLDRVTSVELFSESGGQPAVTTLAYDGLGRLSRVVDAAGHARSQRHDLLGRIIEVSDPNRGVTTFEHDDAGNEIRRTDARGVTVESAYDGANRLVEQWDTTDRSGTLVRQTYDHAPDCPAGTCTAGEGRLVQVDYPLSDGARGLDRIGYDVRGRTILRSRRLPNLILGAAVALIATMSYDNADRLVETRYPDGQQLSRVYDAASRVTAIPGLVDLVTYAEHGAVASIEATSGVETRRSYDDLLRLQALRFTSAAGMLVQGFSYARDRQGNVFAVDDLALAGDALEATADYIYDSRYRLTSATLADGEKLSATYDPIDNILSRTSSLGDGRPGHAGSYTYDPAQPNATTQVGAVSMQHDAAGYLVARGDLDLDWDHLGRLRRAHRSGSEVASFDYGAREERVVKREGPETTYALLPEYEIRDGIGVLYARLDKERVARSESSTLAAQLLSDVAPLSSDGSTSVPDGAITAADAWLAHAGAAGILSLPAPTSEPARLLASSLRRQLMEADAGPVHLHSDHLGSITLATDSQGEVIGRRGYTPYGSLRSGSTPALESYGFTGQERDASTGLDHFQFRYLDSAAGRWASADPKFAVLAVSEELLPTLGQATSAFVYVSGNPINAIDPTGLSERSRPRRVEYGSTELSRRAYRHRKSKGLIGKTRNVAVAQYRDKKGRIGYAEATSETRDNRSVHAEEVLHENLAKLGVDPLDVQAVHSDLNFCQSRGHACRTEVPARYPNAELTYSFNYDRPGTETSREGLRQLRTVPRAFDRAQGQRPLDEFL